MLPSTCTEMPPPVCVYCGAPVRTGDCASAMWPRLLPSGQIELLSGAACRRCQRVQLAANQHSTKQQAWLSRANQPAIGQEGDEI